VRLAAPSIDVSGQARFVALLRDHARMLGQVVHAYGWTEDERRDLEQDVVAQLWKAFPRYDPGRPFSTWMYRIALNVAISFSRRRRELLPIEEAASTAAPEPPSSGEREQELRSLQRFVASLPPLDRALVLLYLDERSQKEIGEVLGISESNVSTKIHRIKRQLREQLERETGGEP
jgi:RNA polymerase sigma-70 factor (ECF subfamily)